jgi:hypothetical protein
MEQNSTEELELANQQDEKFERAGKIAGTAYKELNKILLEVVKDLRVNHGKSYQL